VLKVAPSTTTRCATGEVLADQLSKSRRKDQDRADRVGPWLSRVWKDADYDLTIIATRGVGHRQLRTNPKYYFRYDSGEFQKLFQESEITVDDKARRELYVKMQKKLSRGRAGRLALHPPRLAVTRRACRDSGKICRTGVRSLRGRVGQVAGNTRVARAAVHRQEGRGVRRDPLFRLGPRVRGRPRAARRSGAGDHRPEGSPEAAARLREGSG